MKKNNKPIISLIAVVAKDRGIGKDNKLLFDIPEDLKHFRQITLNHTIIMGYNTYKSIGKALPNRRNIVLSKKIKELKDAYICSSLEEAISITADGIEIFIIGGASIYHQAIKLADKLYLTEVDAVKPADTYFPEYKKDFIKVKKTGGGVFNGLKYEYLEFTK